MHVIYSSGLLLLCALYFVGRKDGTPRGPPNQRMHHDNRVKRVDPSVVPSSTELIGMYSGTIAVNSNFGVDPLNDNQEKCNIRLTFVETAFPPFETIFSEAVNGNKTIFMNNLLLFIDITKRLGSC